MLRFPRSPLLATCAVLGLLVQTAHADAPSSAPASLQTLLMTMSERLSVGELVALTKWDSKQSVQDNAREAVLIADARKEAVERRLDPDEAADLVAAQIEANKLLQYGLLAQWQAAGKAPETPRPDLIGQIRPWLDTLQHRLLQQYADFAPLRRDPRCADWLARERSSLIKDALHGQALIRATGELCIVER